jgi:hypothetical protein
MNPTAAFAVAIVCASSVGYSQQECGKLIPDTWIRAG